MAEIPKKTEAPNFPIHPLRKPKDQIPSSSDFPAHLSEETEGPSTGYRPNYVSGAWLFGPGAAC